MDKHKRKEKAARDKEAQKLEDEELDKVAGGVCYDPPGDDDDDYYYQGAPDD